MATFNKDGNYAFTLLSDSKMEAGKAFGIAFDVNNEKFGKFLSQASGEEHQLLPVPSVYIVEKGGKVAFQYVNPDYRVRIDPQTVLAAAKALAKK